MYYMVTGNSGYEYEKKIIGILKEANIIGDIQQPAGASAMSYDADFRINGVVYNLEIKLDKNAQMGGYSVKYDLLEDKFSFVNTSSDEIDKLLLPIIEAKKPDLIKLIEFVSVKEPTYNKRIPICCTKETWSSAQKENLLINVIVPFDTNFIADYYKKKNVFYIQIGKSGLFYLNDNPANLPIPRLEGKVNIEIRTGSSGSKTRKECGTNMISGGLRVQGRLKTNNKSPHTLDSIEGVNKLLEALNSKSMDSANCEHIIE